MAPWLSVLIPPSTTCAITWPSALHRFWNKHQTTAVEVLLLDDCSTDGSSETIDQLRARWPVCWVLLLHDRNRGLSAARNTMLVKPKGRYIWFLD